MMDMNGIMNGMMAFGWLGLLLGITLLVLVVVGITHLISSRNGGTSDDALSTAGKRYARGDISREEFDDIKRTLG
ncbi:MAG: SHOCT domain-containing protein [Deinococcota bacterium]